LSDEVRPKPHFIRLDALDESSIRGLYSKDLTQYLRITKITIQKYLEACLHPQGQFREFFKQFASFSVQYTVNEALSDDPQTRSIQIGRFFDRTREAPPQIIIQDNGYDYTPASLGSLTEGYNTLTVQGVQIVRVMDVVPIPIEITCAAAQERDLEDLLAMCSAAFGQLIRFTTNYVLRPAEAGNGAYWEVRIPLQHRVSPKSRSPLHNDPQKSFWSATVSMDVEFENSTYVGYRAAPNYVPTDGQIQLGIPDQIPISGPVPFTIKDMPFPLLVYSDDSRIAVVSSGTGNTSFIIRPKRLGKCKILVTKHGVTTGKPIHDGDHKVIAEKEIEVVSR